MRELFAIAIGYLLGSLLPAYLFARAQGVDIRAVGTGNPGATNALRELGVVPGVVTAVWDTSVGLTSMYVAHHLGVSVGWTYLAGVAAVLGHCFPLFFGFHGGQGMAATTGMLVFEIGVAIANGWLTPLDLAVLVAVAATTYALTRSASVVGLIAPPLLVAQVVLSRPDWQYSVFLAGLAAFIWIVQFGIVRERNLFKLAEPVKARILRLRAGSKSR